MSFRVEYKRGSTGPAMFQRHVRFQVDISAITKQTGDNSKEHLYAITFTLLSGKKLSKTSFLQACKAVFARSVMFYWWIKRTYSHVLSKRQCMFE